MRYAGCWNPGGTAAVAEALPRPVPPPSASVSTGHPLLGLQINDGNGSALFGGEESVGKRTVPGIIWYQISPPYLTSRGAVSCP